MIPLERLGDYTDGIERINIEFSIANKLKLVDALPEFFAGELPRIRRQGRCATRFDDRPQQALELLRAVAGAGPSSSRNLDARGVDVRTDLEGLGMDSATIGRDPSDASSSACSCTQMRISWKRSCAIRCARSSAGATSSR